jgi:hypothetical protein
LKRSVAALLGVAFTLAAALGGPTGASATAPSLASRLLTANELPKGWSEQKTVSSGGAGCLHNIFEIPGARQSAHAAVTFTEAGGVPEVEEVLAAYVIPVGQAFDRVLAEMDGCKVISGTASGQKVTGTNRPMPFARYGQASAAFDVHFLIAGTSLGEYALVVRLGGILVGLVEADTGTPSLSLFKLVVNLAMTKLELTA